MTDDVPFHVEMTVENGRGYVPASNSISTSLRLGLFRWMLRFLQSRVFVI
jgi:DNA-directed RNA polymerase alpha subunit